MMTPELNMQLFFFCVGRCTVVSVNACQVCGTSSIANECGKRSRILSTALDVLGIWSHNPHLDTPTTLWILGIWPHIYTSMALGGSCSHYVGHSLGHMVPCLYIQGIWWVMWSISCQTLSLGHMVPHFYTSTGTWWVVWSILCQTPSLPVTFFLGPYLSWVNIGAMKNFFSPNLPQCDIKFIST